MPADPASALTHKLAQFVDLGRLELAALAQLEANPQRLPAGTELVREHQTGQLAYILQDGWACSYKLLPDGGRQVIDFPIPGDVIGLRSLLLRTADHNFSAVTNIVVAGVSSQQLTHMLEHVPRLAAGLLWGASRDEAIVVEHLVNIGRRGALERTAHFLIETGLRLEIAGLDSADSYSCPLSQYQLADTLGMTAIYVNRILRQLRERRLVTFRHSRVTIHDRRELAALAGYHSAYLDQG